MNNNEVSNLEFSCCVVCGTRSNLIAMIVTNPSLTVERDVDTLFSGIGYMSHFVTGPTRVELSTTKGLFSLCVECAEKCTPGLFKLLTLMKI